MSEQELYMIGDDRGKDEIQAQSLLNKHINLEKAVANFKEDIDELHNRAQELVAAEHPERYDFNFVTVLSVRSIYVAVTKKRVGMVDSMGLKSVKKRVYKILFHFH